MVLNLNSRWDNDMSTPDLIDSCATTSFSKHVPEHLTVALTMKRIPDIHKVKSWTHLFRPLIEGKKKHDIRDMRERDYKVGDILFLQEFDMAAGRYTGHYAEAVITYITDKQTPCAFSSSVLDRDFAILSVEIRDVGAEEWAD